MHGLGCLFSTSAHYCHAMLNDGFLRHCLLPTLLHGWIRVRMELPLFHGKLADFRFSLQHFPLSHAESASVIAAGAVAHITSRNAAVSPHMPTIPLHLFHLRQLVYIGHSLFPSSHS